MKTVKEIKDRIKELKAIKTKDRDLKSLIYRELKILGSYSPAPIDIAQSLEYLKTEKVKVKNITTEYQLNEVQKAIEDTLSHKIFKAYIKI